MDMVFRGPETLLAQKGVLIPVGQDSEIALAGVGWPDGRCLFVCLFGWLFVWLVGWLVGWFVGCCWLVCWLLLVGCCWLVVVGWLLLLVVVGWLLLVGCCCLVVVVAVVVW